MRIGDDKAHDLQLVDRWRAEGIERRADGDLYLIATGERTAFQTPEREWWGSGEYLIPPLPDGTRPPENRQRRRVTRS